MADWDERHRRGEHAGLGPDPLLELALLRFAEFRRDGPREGAAPHALDLACGAGRHALRLAEAGFAVTAVDSSPAAVGRVRESALARGLSVDARLSDLERGEFVILPRSFDLVCDFFYLQRDLFDPRPRRPAPRRPLRRGRPHG